MAAAAAVERERIQRHTIHLVDEKLDEFYTHCIYAHMRS